MADYKKVRHRQRPRPLTHTETHNKPDGNFWAKFIKPTTLSFPGAVYSIDFSPVSPHDALVTASARLSLVSGRANPKVIKTYSRINGLAYSGCFRPTDGKLLACGDDQGVVTVFDLASKATLRQYNKDKHKAAATAATRVVKWRKDGLALFSGSDDKSIRCWDLSTGECLASLPQAHDDYIRCGATNPASPDLFVSGSYDHTLTMWDVRIKGTKSAGVASFDHGAPVEACVVLPGGSLLVSAGADTIKVWDLLGAGGRQAVHSFANHAKTITCLTTDSEGGRLLSSSLDGHVKIYDIQNYDVVHSLRFTGPLLSVGLSPNKGKLMVGKADGSLSIRTRRTAATSTTSTDFGGLSSTHTRTQLQQKKPLFGGTTRYFQRGKNAVAGTGDFEVELAKRHRLAPYDLSLKGFRYQEALDNALESRNPRTIVAVVEELLMRRGLRIALTGRDEAGLEPLMAFLARYINHPDFACVLGEACHMVLDMYVPMVGSSPVLDELLGRVSRQIKGEVNVQREFLEVLGGMEVVMATQEGGGGGGLDAGVVRRREEEVMMEEVVEEEGEEEEEEEEN